MAFLIESGDRRVLFDTGQSGTVLLHNLDLLTVKPSSIEAVAISHAHRDHSGGLSALLEHVDQSTPLYGHPDLFRERYSVRNGGLKSVGLTLTREELAARMMLMLDAEPQEATQGVWTTGAIAERPWCEGRSTHQRMRHGGELASDRYLDDMALVLELGDHLVLLCGCCHAGLLNTLAHVDRVFGRPIRVIAGGLHLASAGEDEMERISAALAGRSELQRIYPNHCSGEAAMARLTHDLGVSVVQRCPAGTILAV